MRTSSTSSSRFGFRSEDRCSISRLKEGAQRARHGFGLIEGSQMAAVRNDLQPGMWNEMMRPLRDSYRRQRIVGAVHDQGCHRERRKLVDIAGAQPAPADLP